MKTTSLGNNYVFGIVGAILGAVVGAVPTFLLVFPSQPTYFYLLCFLSPGVSFLGYRLFRGKLTIMATIIVIIISFVMIPVMDYFAEALLYQQEYREWLSIPQYTEALFTPQGEFVASYPQMFLFMSLGVFGANANRRKIVAANTPKEPITFEDIAPFLGKVNMDALRKSMQNENQNAQPKPPKGPDLD